jgi:hypothetical protein
MADINGTDNDDVIRTAAAGGSLGGLPDATDTGDTIIAGAGDDTIIAGAGDDVIDAGDGDDFVEAGDGNDLVAGGDGVDVLDGGDGWDTLDFTNAPGGVAIVLGQGDVFDDGYGNTETGIVNFEYAYGSMHDDFLAGSGGFNVLFGQLGDDSLYGGGGDDILYGQGGFDVVVGEEGADTLYGDGAGGAEDDVLVGGRNDLYDADARRPDDFETDTLYGGGGNDILVVGIGDIGHGEEGDDTFEFAIDINAPRDQQPLAVGTAVFSGDRGDYDIRIDNGRLIVEHLVGGDGRDDVGLAFLTAGGGPQIVAFLQFADQTIDVLNDIPGIGSNLGPDVPSFGISLDANTGIGTGFGVSDPEGNYVSFIGWTNGPANGTLSEIFFDDSSNQFSFSYSPNAGFVGTDSVTFLFQDEFGAQGSGTITFDVLFDSAVADVFTVGVGRSFAGFVGTNDADATGGPPTAFQQLSAPDNISAFAFDGATGAFSITPADAMVFSTQFSYRATFPDGTTNEAPVFIDFVELAEVLVGTTGDETIFGYGLDDVITGGAGDDAIIGGGGFDTAVFSGVLAGYSLVQTGMQVVVTDIDPTDGDDGTDTVLVEALQFADQTVQVVNNFDPLAGTIDGRLVNTLGGPAGFGENVLFRNDDSSSQAIPVESLFGGALDFYGLPITQIFVNNNGNITFTQPIGQFSPTPLGASTTFAIIAGAWSDLDTRFGNVAPSPGGNSTGSNQVFWDLDETNQTFTATWDDVSFYNNGSTPIATFQLQLIGRGGGDFDIVYRYEFLSDSRVARAGFANQDDTAIFELPGSGTSSVGQLDTIAGNTGLPGVWVFSVRQGAFTPTGSPDNYTTDEDTPLVVAGPGVLANDADPLGRPLTAVLSTNPASGSVIFNTDGSFTYTPFADFNGTDSFTYQAVADTLGSGLVTVTINVNGINDAPRNITINDNTTPENLVSGVNTGTNVLVGTLSAFDPESPVGDLSFQLIDDAGGRFVLNGRDLRTSGVLDFETATFHDIAVRVTDPQGASTDQTIRIFVQNINEGPSDIFLTGPGAIFENLPPGTFLGTLTSNDAEGDPITYTRLFGPVNIVGDEVFTTISFDFEFQTQFTFGVRAAEPSGDGVDRQFTIFVDNLNEAPTAGNDLVQAVSEQTATFFVLGNDIDPEGDPLSFVGFTTPANGSVTLNLDDSFTYVPFQGFAGTDSFTYTIADPGGLESTATVTIEVRPGDIIAVDDLFFVLEDTGGPLDVVGNDYLLLPDGTQVDAATAGLTVSAFSQPAHGTVLFSPGGPLTYIPNPNFYGTDSFTYIASDGFSESFISGFVTVEVENVNDDPYQTYIPEFLAVEDRTLFGTLQEPNSGITSIYDPDVWPTPDTLGVAPGTYGTAQGGTVTVHVNKTFDYTPPPGFDGYDSFDIVYNDFAFDFFSGQSVPQGGTHTMLVRINVEAEEPVAVDDRYTIQVGQSVSGNVLANDRSPPGNALVEAQQLGGSIAIDPSGSFFFNGTAAGTYIATYKVEDSAGLVSIDPGLLKIVVLPDPPPPPPPGGSGGTAAGDPHFVTFDGLYFDMQGWGEFILARATAGETFEVQIRTKPWFQGAQVTVVEAVAAAIGNHRVMAHIDGTVLVDGVAASLAVGGDPLLLTGNVRLHRTAEGTYVFADHDTGEQVQIAGVGSDSYMNVSPFVAAARDNAMQGLLGDNDNDVGNDIQLADGTVLAQPVNINDLYGLFANDWRVTNANSLFVYAPGEDTSDFQVLNFPPIPLQVSDLPTALVAAAAAQVAAAGITDPFLAQAALLDLLLTGDENFIQGMQGAQDPDDGLDVFVPPAPPLIGLASPMGDVAEGDAGTTTLTFTVFRTGNAADEVTVDWTVQAAGLGFSNAADHGGSLPYGTVTLLVGELEKTFTVEVAGDLVSELNEEVRVAFTSTPAGYVVASATAQQTVLNDDGPLLPDALDDAATTAAGTPVTLNPLLNDIDPIGTGIALTALGAAGNGTLQQVGNQVTYTPNAGFSGQDAFTYTIGLNGGGTDTATITITVTPPAAPANVAPVANTDLVNTTFNTAIVIPVGQLLANDTDADGNPLSVTGIALQPGQGVAVFDAVAGTITYMPNAGFSGTESFAYAVSDGTVSVQGIVNVTVAPATGGNTAPEAINAMATVEEDGTVGGQLTGFDADGDTLTFLTSLEVPVGFSMAADGTWTYTPPANINGTVVVFFVVDDGAAQSGLGQLAITITPVNDAPTATNGAFATDEDTAFNGNLLALLAAADIDGDDLDIVSIGVTPLGGFAFDAATGAFTFTPDANEFGADTVLVTLTDGTETVTRELAITVNAVNDVPVANGDAFAGQQNANIVGNVLVNDTDIENDPLIALLVNGPQNGQLVLNPNGSFTYTPNAGFTGPDSFTYQADDGSAPSNTATVTLNVVAPPPAGGGASLAFSLWRLALDGTTNLANARDPARNLDYTNASVPGEQASSSTTDSTGPLLARFLSADGDVAVREIDFANGVSVGPNPISIDWTGEDALLSLDKPWGSIPTVRVNEFLGGELTVRNFAGVVLNFERLQGPFQTRDYDLVLDGTQTVSLATAAGDDSILVAVDSAGGSVAQNRLTINTNAGHDLVEIRASTNNYVGGAYDPAITRSIVDLGTGNDTFLGGNGSDIVTGGAGNDTLDGRGGYDIAIFSGNRADYTVTVLDAGSGLSTVSGIDGIDSVVHFEQLRFDDGVLRFQGGIWA